MIAIRGGTIAITAGGVGDDPSIAVVVLGDDGREERAVVHLDAEQARAIGEGLLSASAELRAFIDLTRSADQ